MHPVANHAASESEPFQSVFAGDNMARGDYGDDDDDETQQQQRTITMPLCDK